MLKKNLIEIIRFFMFSFWSITHKLEDKILFSSFNGKQYSDNPRAICEKMHELYPEYELVWYLSGDVKYNILPDYVRVVNGKFRNFILELATSKCYITNTQMGEGIFKRRKQVFVQTWHGDVVPKKVLLSVDKKITVKDRKLTDICIAGSDIGAAVYRKSFDFDGIIFKSGMPRNDSLINKSSKIDVCEIFGIDKNSTKILLYAPTFRDNGNSNFGVDIKRTLDLLERNNEKWICLSRSHVNSGILEWQKDNRIVDVSMYPDMADILLVSDMLITDYSSSPGDFVLTGRPVVLCQFDYDKYEAECRKFEFDFIEAGFIVARTVEEFEDIILNYTTENYEKSDKKVVAYFNIVSNGNASENVCNEIKKIMRIVGEK